MKVNPNIEDLLGSYADGELSARQNTEIRRLTEKNEEVKARLHRLWNLKALVNGLPRLEAPEEIAEQTRLLLERRTLFGEVPSDSKRPIHHLIFQKIRASAAVAGLVAVFFMLVYSIVSPPRGSASKDSVAGDLTPVPSTRTQAGENAGFSGRLELYCSSVPIVDSAIQRAVERNDIADYERQEFRNRMIYQVKCSEAALNNIMLDLHDVWPRLTDSRFYLHTDGFGQCVEVKSISPEQILSIAHQRHASDSLEIAKRMAVRNSIGQMTSTGQVLTSLVDVPGTVPMVPKPMLTAAQPKADPGKGSSGSQERAALTIVLVGMK